MKIRNLLRVSAATFVSLSSLLTINLGIAHAAAVTWTGTSGDHKFSTAGNWSGNAVPNNGDALTFPEAATDKTPNNDLTNASFALIQFSGGTVSTTGYTITGNPLTLGNINDGSTTADGNTLNLNVTASSGSGFFGPNGNPSTDVPLTIGDLSNIGSKTLAVGANSITLRNVIVASAVTGGSSALITTSSGATDFGVDFEANSSGYAGNIHQTTPSNLYLEGQFSAASVLVDTGGTLNGDGGAGTVQIASGANLPPGYSSTGCITTGHPTIAGTVNIEIDGATSACTDFDQITGITGQVVLSNPTLNVTLGGSFTPTVGQKFVIINNSFGGSVNGTFSNLAEGTVFSVGSYKMSISYTGNNQHDVVLTVVDPSTPVGPAGTGSSTTAAPKAPNTGMRLVAANPGVSALATLASLGGIVYISRRMGLVGHK